MSRGSLCLDDCWATEGQDNPPTPDFYNFEEDHPSHVRFFLETWPLGANARVHVSSDTTSAHTRGDNLNEPKSDRKQATGHTHTHTRKMAPMKETMAMVAAALWLASVDSFLTPVPVGRSRAGNRAALAYRQESVATNGIQARPQQQNVARRQASMSAAPGKAPSSG